MSTATATLPVPATANPKLRQVADLLAIGSNPTRAAVIVALRDGGLETYELATAVGIDRQGFAQYGQILRAANLITTIKTGRGSLHELTEKGRRLLAALDALSRD
jgi:DNA-binding transcriptional ArsR family regulator